MCLLHTHPITTEFNREDIDDFYSHNSDGLGVMWAEDNVLYTVKALPRTSEEAWAFYSEHIKGRDCVVHWRMKTHGLIDTTNCHPYTVFGAGSIMPISIMHNGILASGNAKDVTKSDTWHYVQDTLVPLLANNPALFNVPQFIDIIESHIGGGNRFVMMNHKGEIAIMNKDSFVTYKGALLSNTYAWTASRGGLGAKSYSYGGGKSTWKSAWELARDEGEYTWPEATTVSKAPTVGEFFRLLKDNGQHVAHQRLTFHNVDQCIKDNGEEAWTEFCELVDQIYMTDEEVIWNILDSNYMAETLYGDPEDNMGYEYVATEDEGRLKVGMR